jgi:glycerol-3-phosphate acyltransferase PlsY
VHYAIVAAVAVVGYVLGTFPSAIIVAKANGIDITTQGSGNPGASNVARTLGWKRGAFVGHIFPVTRGFRGGKGVATGSGAITVLQPVLSAVLFAIWMALSKTTKKASIASVVVTVGVPIGMAIIGVPAWEILAMVGLSFLVVARHLPNLRRLRSGTEHSLDRRAA